MTTRREVLMAAPAGAALLLESCASSQSPVIDKTTGIPITGERRGSDLSLAASAIFDAHRQSVLRVMSQHRIPGVSVACIDRQRILWQAGFGVADQKTGEHVTPQTVFSLQSISKTVTSTAIMLAVEDGLLDLDKPITAYVPGFRVSSRFETNPQDKITLRLLLSHRAGFTGDAAVGSNHATSPSFDAHVLSIRETWLRSPVGSRYDYANLDTDLAGYVLQQVAGKPFEHLMQEQLFAPLGMARSFVDTPTKNGAQRGCARGHNAAFSRLPDYIPMAPSGGVRASAEDGARFIQFHLNRGRVGSRERLAPARLDEMYRPAARTEEGWYGLGVATFQYKDTYLITHGGGGFGFLTTMVWLPQYGIGVVVLTNSADHPSVHQRLAVDLMTALHEVLKKAPDVTAPETILAGAPTSLTQPTEWPATPYRADWVKYVGRYRIVFDRSFQLASNPAGQALSEAGTGTVYEQDGFLSANWVGNAERLIEHLPGLFFGARSGEALDFRNPTTPRARNIALQKVG